MRSFRLGRAAAVAGAIIALVAVTADGATAATSGGSLDPTFGGDGRVVTDLGAEEGAVAVAVLADGKILVATPHALVRYDSFGALDATFAGDGILAFPFSQFVAADMAIAPGGEIVVVGRTTENPDTDLAVARFSDDVTPDATFGEDGLATFDLDGNNEEASGVAIQPDGRIVVVGKTDVNHELGDGIVLRFTSEGALDSSFAGFGWRGAFPYGVPDDATAVSLQANGKIVVAGDTYTEATCCSPGGVNFALARFRTDGKRDTSFSGDGAVRTAFGSDRYDRAEALVIQAGGNIVAGGSTQKGLGFDSEFALARYNHSGKLDTTFSSDGKQRTHFGGRVKFDAAHAIVLQANGRIVLVGEASGRFALARYRTGGNLDDTFGGNGKVRTRFGSNDGDYGYDTVVQSNGRIVVVGKVTTTAGAVDVGLARYLP